MKKLLKVSVILFLIIALSGCDYILNEHNNTDRGNITDKENYPPQVSIWLNNMQEYFAAGDLKLSEGRYLIVNWGQKPSAGYQVTINGIEETQEKIIAYVSFKEPDRDVAQVISFPNDIKKITNMDKNIVLKPEGAEEYVPRIVGRQPVTPFIAESDNIKILQYTKDKGKINIAGIARVFEAHVSYALEDQQENVLQEGYTMAASGGPDWGSFEIEISDIPDTTYYLKVFSVSMKDGSRNNVISLE